MFRRRSVQRTQSSKHHLIGMLRSARYGHSVDGQMAMIGTGGPELELVLETVCPYIPRDILSVIADLVGHALVWLRAPGLNLLKWSAKSLAKRQRDGEQAEMASLSVFGGGCGFSDNEFYFSGYGDEAAEDLVFGLDALSRAGYVDLDWCFAAFLVLGLVPEESEDEKDGHWARYLNHKLLSALPSNCPLETLMAS